MISPLPSGPAFVGPPYLAQLAGAYSGVLDLVWTDNDVDGKHHMDITFPNMWKAMRFRELVMRTELVGIPPPASSVDLDEGVTVTSVAQPVTLRVVSNPDYADAIHAAYFAPRES